MFGSFFKQTEELCNKIAATNEVKKAEERINAECKVVVKDLAKALNVKSNEELENEKKMKELEEKFKKEAEIQPATETRNIIHKFDIFKSYAHKDRERVDPFISMLTHQFGLKVWVDTTDLEFGADWQNQLVKGINESSLVLCFITQNYLDSKTCRFELKKASELGKKFFLVMIEDVAIDKDAELLEYIGSMQRVHMFDKACNRNEFWSGDMFFKLLNSISQVTGVEISIVKTISKDKLGIKDWNNIVELGSGASAVVYKAVYEGNAVAVKKFRALYPSGKDNERNFKNEIELLGRMKHENIVQLIGYYNKGDTYLVLEYMSGGSLYDLLYNKDGPFVNWDKRIKIMKCIIRGLDYLHESHKMIHGDIKSLNVLLNGNYTVAKLTDFGLSTIRNTISSYSISHKNSKNTSGSIRWIAPERLSGKKTCKSDIWSFGLVLRELALKLLPFDTIDDTVLLNILLNDDIKVPLNLDEVPNKIAAIIESCVVRDLNKRATTQDIIERFTFINSQDDIY